jgi:hypothetical protein
VAFAEMKEPHVRRSPPEHSSKSSDPGAFTPTRGSDRNPNDWILDASEQIILMLGAGSENHQSSPKDAKANHFSAIHAYRRC